MNEPLSPPSVDEERIEPPFTAAMCATEPAVALNVPLSIVTAICPSLMIFERSPCCAAGALEAELEVI